MTRVCQRQQRHLCESLREWLLVPPFNRAFLNSPSSRGLSAIAELLVTLIVIAVLVLVLVSTIVVLVSTLVVLVLVLAFGDMVLIGSLKVDKVCWWCCYLVLRYVVLVLVLVLVDMVLIASLRVDKVCWWRLNLLFASGWRDCLRRLDAGQRPGIRQNTE